MSLKRGGFRSLALLAWSSRMPLHAGADVAQSMARWAWSRLPVRRCCSWGSLTPSVESWGGLAVVVDGAGGGCRLAELRRAYGLSRAQVAAASGVGLGLVGELERGRLVSVAVGKLVRVAWALGLPVSEVWPAFAADAPRPGLVHAAQAIAVERAEALSELRELRRPKRQRRRHP